MLNNLKEYLTLIFLSVSNNPNVMTEVDSETFSFFQKNKMKLS